MVISLQTAALSAMLASLLLASALTYLRSLPNTPKGLSWWACGFWVYAGANGCVAFLSLATFSVFLEILLTMSAFMIAAGTWRFLGHKVLVQFVVLGISLVVFWILAVEVLQFHELIRTVPVFTLTGGVLIFAGVSLWREGGADGISAGYRVTGAFFVLWGVHKLDYPFLSSVEWFAPYGFLLAELLAFACVVGLLIVAQENAIARADAEAAARSVSDAALLQQVDFQQSIIDAVPMPIFVENHAGLMVNANLAFAGLIGPGRSDLAERNLAGVWAEFGILQAMRPESGSVQDGGVRTLPVEITLPSRQIRSYILSKMPLAIPDDSQSGIIGVMQDVTERNRTISQLRKSEKRFRDFAEASSDWLWETDAAGRFSYFAHGARDYNGLFPDCNLGRTRFEATIEDLTSEKWRRHISDIEARRPFRGFRYLLSGEDGREVAVMINGVPFYDEEGTFLGYRGTGSEVTRQREAEISRDRALLVAERANRAKSEFLATMSHEFRTPLNAILGFSEMLSQEVLGPVGAPAYREYANAINDSGTHMLALVNDILDIAAIEAGKRIIMKEEIGLLDLLRESTVEVSKIAADKSINLEVGVPRSPLHLLADLRSVRQIILNLLSNSVKFTPQGGWIRLSAEPDRGDMIAIVVEDNGEGIAADKLPTITDPFSQASNHPHHSHEGTGLGLSIVKSLVDAHSGELKIESTLGIGTKVTVWLHAALGPNPALHEIAPVGPKADAEEDSLDV